MGKHIELNRNFIPVSDTDISEQKDSLHLFEFGRQFNNVKLGWKELLDEYRVILLAEAGAGKTQEIHHITSELNTKGKHAFFFRLENIVDGLEFAFEMGSYSLFKQWLSSNQEGWLFLDSVDEARLKDPRDFNKALYKLNSELANVLQRTHIIITSRVSAWRKETDLALCNNLFPFQEILITDTDPSINSIDVEKNNSSIIQKKQINQNERDDNEIIGFKIYGLSNLTTEQIKIYIKEKGILDYSKFLDEIERKDAWVYTTRPQDLEDLVKYWNKNKRIGSRLDIVKDCIERRLEEREENRATLNSISRNKIIEGVELLAAASTFMRKPNITIPDGTNNYNEGINVKSILKDWNDKDCKTLLERPIFDPATYGCVRFHHRSVKEYLTANWLFDKLKSGQSRKNIEDLFFRNQYGLMVIVPSMRPILSWLALHDSIIMEKVYTLDPEIILEGGDPLKLPVENRQSFLRAICKKISKGTFKSSIFGEASFQRFGSNDLASDIIILFEQYKDNHNVTGYLINLIKLCRIQGCLTPVLSIAKNNNYASYLRSPAFSVVKEEGSIDDFKEILDSFLATPGKYNKRLVADIIYHLEPSTESVSWIITALSNVDRKNTYDTDGLVYSFEYFFNKSSFEVIYELIKGIDKLLKLNPIISRGDCDVSKTHGWLMPISLKAIIVLIKNKNVLATSDESLFVLLQMPAFENDPEFGSKLNNTEIINLIAECPELNKKLFWFTVEKSRIIQNKKNNQPLTDINQISYWRFYWKFNVSDFESCKEDIIKRKSIDDKLVALSLIFQLYVVNKRPKNWLRELKNIASTEEKLKIKLHFLLKPPPMTAETKKYRLGESRWKRQDNIRERKKIKQHEQNVNWLKSNLDNLLEPISNNNNVSSGQRFLYDKMIEKNGSAHARHAASNWEDLIDDYGLNVAETFRDGLVKLWRTHLPKLRSENQNDQDSSILYSILLGLSGLELECFNGVEKFNESDAEIACRYALYESQSLPDWFKNLYNKYPRVCFELILKEISWELKSKEFRHYTLSKISGSENWIWEDLASQLLNYLIIDPLNKENLFNALKIIQNSKSVTDKELSALANKKCNQDISLEYKALWFSCWIGSEPQLAINSLESFLEKLNSQNIETAKEFAMKTIVSLIGLRYNKTNTRQKYKLPIFLKQLFILMHRYINKSEDINRAGSGSYSPQLRDDAQEARDAIFPMLKEIPGKDTYLALIELYKSNTIQGNREWILQSAKERAELDSENSVWNEETFVEFSTSLDRIPNNQRDLFDLAVQRLIELKYQLEDGDTSIASILVKEKDERKIRLYIAGCCRDKAFGKYLISQEDELADLKKPDLRFLSSNIDAPIPVELKLADNWSGAELMERMENQLGNDYLRDMRSNYGIYLLVYRGDQKSWVIKNRKLDFSDLIVALKNRWMAIQNNFSKVEQIEVIGIDLTKRSTEKRNQN